MRLGALVFLAASFVVLAVLSQLAPLTVVVKSECYTVSVVFKRQGFTLDPVKVLSEHRSLTAAAHAIAPMASIVVEHGASPRSLAYPLSGALAREGLAGVYEILGISVTPSPVCDGVGDVPPPALGVIGSVERAGDL